MCAKTAKETSVITVIELADGTTWEGVLPHEVSAYMDEMGAEIAKLRTLLNLDARCACGALLNTDGDCPVCDYTVPQLWPKEATKSKPELKPCLICEGRGMVDWLDSKMNKDELIRVLASTRTNLPGRTCGSRSLT